MIASTLAYTVVLGDYILTSGIYQYAGDYIEKLAARLNPDMQACASCA